MNDFRIESAMTGTAGNIVPLAEHLMNEALAFFADPAGEAEYQAWKKARDEAQRGA